MTTMRNSSVVLRSPAVVAAATRHQHPSSAASSASASTASGGRLDLLSAAAAAAAAAAGAGDAIGATAITAAAATADAENDSGSATPTPTGGGGKGPKLICLVCGDVATGRHYGSIACNGCKGFFRRTIRRSYKYQCRFDSNCRIEKHNRAVCRACRYARCINFGMRTEAVQSERDLIGKRTRPSHSSVDLVAFTTSEEPSSSTPGFAVPHSIIEQHSPLSGSIKEETPSHGGSGQDSGASSAAIASPESAYAHHTSSTQLPIITSSSSAACPVGFRKRSLSSTSNYGSEHHFPSASLSRPDKRRLYSNIGIAPGTSAPGNFCPTLYSGSSATVPHLSPLVEQQQLSADPWENPQRLIELLLHSEDNSNRIKDIVVRQSLNTMDFGASRAQQQAQSSVAAAAATGSANFTNIGGVIGNPSAAAAADNSCSKLASVNDILHSLHTQLLLVIEWAKTLKPFSELSTEDQTALLKNFASQHIILCVSYRSMYTSNSLKLINDSCIPRLSDDQSDKETFYYKDAERIMDTLVAPMRFMQMDDVEFVCLKACVLFNPVARGLSADSVMKVLETRRMIFRTLEQYERGKRPSEVNRIGDLLFFVLSPLQALAKAMSEDVLVSKLSGMARLDQLMEELILEDNTESLDTNNSAAGGGQQPQQQQQPQRASATASPAATASAVNYSQQQHKGAANIHNSTISSSSAAPAGFNTPLSNIVPKKSMDGAAAQQHIVVDGYQQQLQQQQTHHNIHAAKSALSNLNKKSSLSDAAAAAAAIFSPSEAFAVLSSLSQQQQQQRQNAPSSMEITTSSLDASHSSSTTLPPPPAAAATLGAEKDDALSVERMHTSFLLHSTSGAVGERTPNAANGIASIIGASAATNHAAPHRHHHHLHQQPLIDSPQYAGGSSSASSSFSFFKQQQQQPVAPPSLIPPSSSHTSSAASWNTFLASFPSHQQQNLLSLSSSATTTPKTESDGGSGVVDVRQQQMYSLPSAVDFLVSHRQPPSAVDAAPPLHAPIAAATSSASSSSMMLVIDSDSASPYQPSRPIYSTTSPSPPGGGATQTIPPTIPLASPVIDNYRFLTTTS